MFFFDTSTCFPPIVFFFFDTVPYEEDLSPLGSIVLEETPPVVKTHFAKKFAAVKSKPPPPKQHLNASLSSRTYGSKRKTSPKASITQFKRKVCLLNHSFISIHNIFLLFY